METRKTLLCPVHIECALAKYYSDLLYTPKSLPHFLILAKFSSDSKGLVKFSSDSKTISKIFKAMI